MKTDDAQDQVAETPITEQLRAVPDGWRTCSDNPDDPMAGSFMHGDLLRRAADEIDRLATHLRAALGDVERAVWVVRFVRACLDADNGLERLTQAFGDAPSDCGCREASCPHVPWFPLSDESVVEMIESAHAKMREES